MDENLDSDPLEFTRLGPCGDDVIVPDDAIDRSIASFVNRCPTTMSGSVPRVALCFEKWAG